MIQSFVEFYFKSPQVNYYHKYPTGHERTECAKERLV